MKALFQILTLMMACIIIACDQKSESKITMHKANDSLSYYTGVFAAYTVQTKGNSELNSEIFQQAIRAVLHDQAPPLTREDLNYSLGWHFDKIQQEKEMKEEARR